MSEPCHQTGTIKAIHTTLERLESSNDRLLDVLTQIAEQGATIKSLQVSDNRHEKAFDNLFGRVNKLEVQGKAAEVKVGIIMAGISAVTAFVTSLFVKN